MGLIKLLIWIAGFAAASWGLLIGSVALLIDVPVGLAIILVSIAISQKLL